MTDFGYIRDPSEIYERSFATVQAESDLSMVPLQMRSIATRLIHSCGMIDIVDDLAFSAEAAEQGRHALMIGKPIFTDVEMVKVGIIRSRLPEHNSVICTLNLPEVPLHAKRISTTRSAAAVDFWGDQLDGAVVAVGNAPTALFHLLDLIEAGGPRPALIIGIPVGFVGAVESKEALSANTQDVDFITVHGRRGGSAMASAVVNALSFEANS